MQGEHPEAGGKRHTPFPFVLFFLDSLEKINFVDESEACSRLNVECEEGRKAAIFEYSEKRKAYILLNYSLV